MLLICVIALIFLIGIYPVVRFTREQIDIIVHEEHVKVNGIYVYMNPFPFPVVQGFSIPFPVDSGHPNPIQISVKDLSRQGKSIPIRFILGKHRFNLAFRAGEEIRIQVQYIQYASEKNASYILTTTKPWKFPLIQGIYRLFPKGVEIISSNYTLKPNGFGALCFLRKNFMPQTDWLFSWEVE